MTDITIHFSGASFGSRWLASLERSFHRAMMTRSIRRTLSGLPDAVLDDIGVTRGEIAVLAGKFAAAEGDTSRHAARLCHFGINLELRI